MAVIAVSGDNLIALFEVGLHADHNRFLADIEMAKAANKAHAVKLSRLFFKAPDQQHVGVEFSLCHSCLMLGNPKQHDMDQPYNQPCG
jgi:hypothetical protein